MSHPDQPLRSSSTSISPAPSHVPGDVRNLHASLSEGIRNFERQVDQFEADLDLADKGIVDNVQLEAQKQRILTAEEKLWSQWAELAELEDHMYLTPRRL